MAIRVIRSDDAAWALSESRPFLATEPVFHNLILALLHERAAYPEPGRYWLAIEDGKVAGVAFQSPLNMPAMISLMGTQVIEALVDAIAGAGDTLPGVRGDAATAARFAGQWTERCKSAAAPVKGDRLYEVEEVRRRHPVSGYLRNAAPGERDLMIGWLRAFVTETRVIVNDLEVLVDRSLTSRRLWIWDDGEPVSMTISRECVEGVVRLAFVYTPPEKRARGYAEACVGELSRRILANGYRCILNTDLANPTSNSVYRRIGYRAVAEALRYRFE